MRVAWLLWHLAGLAALLSTAAAGQIHLSGRVVDDNGTPVAKAHIQLRLPSTGFSALTISDERGRFEADLPQPGPYILEASKEGFFALRGLEVLVSQQTELLTVTLNHIRELVETVNVVYSAPAVDSTETAQRRQLNNMQVLEIPFPAAHDFRNALPMFPGVIQDRTGNFHIKGGRSEQSAYLLDGFNIADPFTGRLETRVSIDAIRTLELDTDRFDAGKPGGIGVLDIVTGMGDDHLRLGATNFIPGLSFERGFRLNKWTPRITVSGPIVRGRAWFHNGLEAFYDVDIVRELPPGQDRTRSLTAGNLTRFQVNLTPWHVFTASLLANLTDTDRHGLSFLTPPEATLRHKRQLGVATFKDQIIFARHFLVEFGFALTRGSWREIPWGQRTYIITPYGFRGNHYRNVIRRTWREEWATSLAIPVGAGQGRHELRAGLLVERTGFDQTSARHDFQIWREDGTLARWVRFGPPRNFARQNLRTAFFLSDRWSMREGLAISVGLRAERNKLTSGLLPGPRAAVAWAPTRLSGWKISAGLGLYPEPLRLSLFAAPLDQAPVTAYFPRCPVPPLLPPSEVSFFGGENRARLPRSVNFSMAVERMLGSAAHLNLSYAGRRHFKGLMYLNRQPVVPGQKVFYALSGARQDRYDGLEITLRNVFGGRYEWLVSYTYSRARSNGAVDFWPDKPTLEPQGPGPLPWDAPHRFVSWGWVPWPASLTPGWLKRLLRETSIAWLLEARSGFPFSVYNEEGFRVGPVNSWRFPAYFNLNLHAEKKVRFLGTLWAVRAGFNNITNHGNPNVVNNNVDSPFFLSYGGGQRRAANMRIRLLGRIKT